MRALPTGTVTFLFTDIEGSTKLLHELGDAYADALAEHRRLLRNTFERHGGVEVDTQGDAFFVAFARASDAIGAADAAQQALARGPIRVRMGLHTGEPLVTDEGYVGIDVHRAARIATAAHGGQVVLSDRTRQLADGGTAIIDLGRHRLKDLAEPERLHQLGDEPFPPLRSLNATNLPVQPEPLVGRERELAEVQALLEQARLVTLTGAGGSGKTRLALQVAAEVVDEFKDGVFWISLAAVTDPTLVLPTVASVVGADDVVEFVGEKRLLLLLDNLEQVLTCGADLADLLRRCPSVRVLATSRAPLRISGEQQYEVVPLPENDAVELFEQRARRVRPEFVSDDAVGKICRRLDGLPLALELAAARVKVLTTKQILDRLGRSLDLLAAGARDLPSRQQTLRATIEWSYELLDEPERQLFARLAIFAGSFDLDGAERVCAGSVGTLEALIDKSLVRRTEHGRFFLLETIGEYARDVLAARADAEELRERHRLFFLELAEREAPHVRGPGARATLDRLEADHPNLQLAVRTALEDGDGEIGLRLTAALHPFWYLHGHYTIGRMFCENALAAPADVSASLRVQGLGAAAEFALMQGNLERARTLLEERLALCERGVSERMASTLTFLGHLGFLEGDLDETERLYARALAREREAPSADPWLDRATALSNLGFAQLYLRRFDAAERTLQEGLAVATAAGDDVGRSRLANNLARVAFASGDDARARSLASDSLTLLQGLKDEQAIAECFDIVACVAARRGAGEIAAVLAGARDRVREQLGVDPEAEAVPDAGRLAALSVELGDEWAGALEYGKSLTLDAAIEYALASAS